MADTQLERGKTWVAALVTWHGRKSGVRIENLRFEEPRGDGSSVLKFAANNRAMDAEFDDEDLRRSLCDPAVRQRLNQKVRDLLYPVTVAVSVLGAAAGRREPHGG